MALDNTIAQLVQKLDSWAHDAILLIPNLMVAMFVILVCWMAARTGRELVYSVLKRLTGNPEVATLLSGLSYAAFMVAGIAIALGILKLEKTVTSLMTGIGILGLTLGFALQDIAANLVAGILIQIRQPYRVGDVIATAEYTGHVDRITLRATEVTRLDGQFVLIPNKDIFNRPVINNSGAAARRVDVEMPVPADYDLKQALASARAAITRVSGRAEDRQIELFFDCTGDGAITLLTRFWIVSTEETAYLRARSDAIQNLKDALEKPSSRKALPAQRAS